MENGGRERDRGSESDEDDDSQQNTSDTGGWGGRSYIRNTAKETAVQSVCHISSRSWLDGRFQGLQRDRSVPNPSRVGQLSCEWRPDTGNWLGQLH